MQHIAQFAVGLLLLAAGAPLLAVGSARLDRATGRGALAVGLVAVGLGPCVAGLAFALAIVTPAPGMAVGSIIGGNVAGLTLVLGMAAIVRPVAARAKVYTKAIPLIFAAVLLFCFLASDRELSRADGGILLAAGGATIGVLAWMARREAEQWKATFAACAPDQMALALAGALACAGLSATVFGALMASRNAVGAARSLGLAPGAVGGTLAAFGTSLPALVAATLAARARRPDLVLAIVLGHALYNLLIVAGLVTMVRPLALESRVVRNELPAMALLALPLARLLVGNRTLGRVAGGALVAAYAGFVVWQVVGK